MQVEKIKIGRSYDYYSRVNPRSNGTPFRGKVTDITTKATGAWVTIHDNNRDVVIVVRPSQVGA